MKAVGGDTIVGDSEEVMELSNSRRTACQGEASGRQEKGDNEKAGAFIETNSPQLMGSSNEQRGHEAQRPWRHRPWQPPRQFYSGLGRELGRLHGFLRTSAHPSYRSKHL